jgi:uncharacterized protein (DUF952 family)
LVKGDCDKKHPMHISHLTNTFNFSKAIKDGSFTVDDIGIANGTIHSDSFTKVSDKLPLAIKLVNKSVV